MTQSSLVRVAIGLFAICAFLFVTLTQRHYPAPSCDEVGYSAAAQGWLNTGTPSWEPIMPLGDPYGRDANIGFQGRGYLALLAGNFAIFGTSLDLARIISVVGWAIAVGLTYQLGQMLFSTQIGLLSALMFGVLPKTFFSAHFARPESWTIAAILAACGYATHTLTHEKPNRLQFFLLGILLVIPGFFHGNGFIFGAVLASGVGIQLFRTRRIAALGDVLLGYLLAGGLWIATHIGLTPSSLQQALWYTTFASDSTSVTAETSILAGMATLPSWLRTTYWSGGSQLETLLFGIASAALIFNRDKHGIRILGLIAATLLLFGLFFSQRFFQYAALWAPFVSIVTVVGLACCLDWLRSLISVWPGLRAETLLVVLILTVSSGYLAIDALFTWRNIDGDYAQTAEEIAALVPNNSTVLADATWWWAFEANHTFLSDEYLFMLPNAADTRVQDFLAVNADANTDQVAHALFATLQPDYVILDSASGCNMGPTADWDAAAELVATACKPVGNVAGNWVDDPLKATSQFGQTSTVYSCDWGE